jgi:hypothetical protein
MPRATGRAGIRHLHRSPPDLESAILALRQGASARWVDDWMPAEDRYLAAEGPDAFADL